ncbi:MAG TPA: glutamate--tRNA ligase [Candidatus Woesebacteria bacterium]|nr:glutamate--tRNA ligase [Candidatus Woesebacteria bacterium]
MVRTRFAPSPTGEIHLGALRTLLYNYALAKHYQGRFILRIEDTDRKRYVEGAEKRIIEDIKAYGLSWDEGPFYQSQRAAIYQQYAQQLLAHGQAYYCFCSPERLAGLKTKYDRYCLRLSQREIKEKLEKGEPYVIRLKMPDGEVITFNDAVRGEISFQTDDLDDQVLIKSDGLPTYHLAVVVDDHLMEISHVLRGDEWISSTPKQILLYRYFGWKPPIFAHLTALLDASGKGKMSKRSGATMARQFLEEGFLPEAVLNYLMLLGWNPGTDQEFFSLNEFVKVFSLEHLHKSQPAFDRQKLLYFNGFYLRQKTDKELARLLPQADPRFIPLIKSRIFTLNDADNLLEFATKDLIPPRELLDLEMLKEIKNILETKDFANLQNEFLNLIKEKKYQTGDFFMTLRLAICGKKITPPIVESMLIIGREACLRKINKVLENKSQ